MSFVSDRFGLAADVELVELALRRNPKRAHLLVSTVLGKHIPTDQKIYSWWSYRAQDWAASDRGRRLDHIWATADVAALSCGAEIIRPARGWSDKPSDHVPVIVRLG